MSLIWERYSMSHKPFIFLCDVDLSPPDVHEKTADADRLKKELGKKGLPDVVVPLKILRRLPEELRTAQALRRQVQDAMSRLRIKNCRR